MSGKNGNRFESLLGVWTNPVYKTSWVSLPAKETVTVGFSSGFNVKLLHVWSNFDLPKFMPVEHIFLMPSSCLSLTLIHARNTPISYSLRLSQSGICRHQRPQKWIKGGCYSRRPFPSLPYPLPFSLFPYPLPLSTPATNRRLPAVVKTRGVNVPCSITITHSAYCIRVCIRVTHPNVEECRFLSLMNIHEYLALIFKRASGALLAPWFNVSPVTS